MPNARTFGCFSLLLILLIPGLFPLSWLGLEYWKYHHPDFAEHSSTGIMGIPGNPEATDICYFYDGITLAVEYAVKLSEKNFTPTQVEGMSWKKITEPYRISTYLIRRNTPVDAAHTIRNGYYRESGKGYSRTFEAYDMDIGRMYFYSHSR